MWNHNVNDDLNEFNGGHGLGHNNVVGPEFVASEKLPGFEENNA